MWKKNNGLSGVSNQGKYIDLDIVWVNTNLNKQELNLVLQILKLVIFTRIHWQQNDQSKNQIQH